MDEIQVDPKLFVTCRLCLEDLGQYQIVPSVQQQIKYCFEIEVEPFDGLPQLICTKCKEILNKFHTIKTSFCGKQADLRNKVKKKDEIFCIEPQHDTVSSSQHAPETIEEPQKPSNQIINDSCKTKTQKLKRKRLLLQSSSSESESEQSSQTSRYLKKKSLKHRGPMPWEADYKKIVSCKLCLSTWSSRRSLANHNRTHDHLWERFKHIFQRQCTVVLDKIDPEPNLTGLNNMVVHSSRKIVAHSNSYFYTIYVKEVKEDTDHDDDNLQDEGESKESEGEEDIGFKTTQRKRRLMSRSSNETVVIESNSNKLSDEEDSKSPVRNSVDRTSNNDECINIDDSTDGDSDQGKLEKNGKVKQPIEAQLSDYKVIQGIISMCNNSYHKKNETAELDMVYMSVKQNKKKENAQLSNESHLKHKVLSIGRKIINKQGFNCTGLLRYMEHKSLEIVWMVKQQLLHSKDTNYIRILTKLRGDLNLDDEPGWLVSLEVLTQSKTLNSVSLNNSIKIAPNKPLSIVPVSNDSPAAKIPISKLPNDETIQQEKNYNQAKLDSVPAMLSYLDSKASTSDSKKLLNANPVANPKQLPKKLGASNESRSSKTVVQQSQTQPASEENDYCLPIITSTTSLANIPSTDQPQDTSSNQIACVTLEENNQTETPTPRIKVKPASELMSEKTLDRMKVQATDGASNNMFVRQIENVWPQYPMNVFVPTITPQMIVTSPPIQILQLPALDVNTAYQSIQNPIPSTQNTKPEYIILDTTDFPNTNTESPLKYVKDLLQLHNLILLNCNEQLFSKFICLIKFKVVFKQDYQKDPPVILCLSLSCCKNTFCFQVRDRNQEIIDMTKISANWQWEILQTYCGDVSNKVLQNARKFGQETFDLTNKLFCLLKAIKCRKPSRGLEACE